MTSMWVDTEQLTLGGEWPEPSELVVQTLAPLAFPYSIPLGAAREVLLERLDAGTSCPCCGRTARRYRRQVNVEMALTLVELYRNHGRAWAYLKEVRRDARTSNREESKLRYWGLIEEEISIRRDDGGRAGWWRVTEIGERYARGDLAIPKYALEWDARCVGLEGELLTIRDALKNQFDLGELLGTRAPA